MRPHSDALSRRVIMLFLLGMPSMAIFAIGIDWASVGWRLTQGTEYPRLVDRRGGHHHDHPALNAFVGVFGLGQIIWFIWLAIVLLRRDPSRTA